MGKQATAKDGFTSTTIQLRSALLPCAPEFPASQASSPWLPDPGSTEQRSQPPTRPCALFIGTCTHQYDPFPRSPIVCFNPERLTNTLPHQNGPLPRSPIVCFNPERLTNTLPHQNGPLPRSAIVCSNPERLTNTLPHQNGPLPRSPSSALTLRG